MKSSVIKYFVPHVLYDDKLWQEYFISIFSFIDDLNSRLLGLIHSDFKNEFYFQLSKEFWVLSLNQSIHQNSQPQNNLDENDISINEDFFLLSNTLLYSYLFFSFPEYYRIISNNIKILNSSTDYRLDFEIDFSNELGEVEQVIFIPYKFLLGNLYRFSIDILYENSDDSHIIKFNLFYSDFKEVYTTSVLEIDNKNLREGYNEVEGRINLNGFYIQIVKSQGQVGKCYLSLYNVIVLNEYNKNSLSRILYLYDFFDLDLDDVQFHFNQTPFKNFNLSQSYLSRFLSNLNVFISRLGSYESLWDYFYFNTLNYKVVELYANKSILNKPDLYVSGDYYKSYDLDNYLDYSSAIVVNYSSNQYSDRVPVENNFLTKGDVVYVVKDYILGESGVDSLGLEVIDSGVNYVILSKPILYNNLSILQSTRIKNNILFYLDIDFNYVEAGDYIYTKILVESTLDIKEGSYIYFINFDSDIYNYVNSNQSLNLVDLDSIQNLYSSDYKVEVVSVNKIGFIYELEIKILKLDIELSQSIDDFLYFNFLLGYSYKIDLFLGHSISPNGYPIKTPYVDIYLNSNIFSLNYFNRDLIKSILYSILPANIVIRNIELLSSGEQEVLLDIDDYLNYTLGFYEQININEQSVIPIDINTYVCINDFSDIVYSTNDYVVIL